MCVFVYVSSTIATFSHLFLMSKLGLYFYPCILEVTKSPLVLILKPFFFFFLGTVMGASG